MFEKINKTLNEIKNEKPLILNVTNDVTIDFVANGLLSLGASPVMSKAENEIEDLLNLASVVVVNLGTLDEKFIQLCLRTCQLANKLKKPIILDPVGAGATSYRTNTCLKLINEYAIAIIRGNASEIMSLAGYTSLLTKGVDSTADTEDAIESAHQLSTNHDTTVVTSGKIDLIVKGEDIKQFQRGSAMMTDVTGMGCLLSAVVGAFHAVEKNSSEAACLATLFYSVCGEIAEQEASGPGSFKVKFLDALHAKPKREQYEKK